jgi:FkbM family methyltransferase
MANGIKRYIQQEFLALHHASSSAERKAFARTLHALDAAHGRTSGKEGVVVPIMGHPMRGYSSATLHYLFNEVFLKGDYRFTCGRPDPVIIDCGANIGFATLYFKLLYPGAKVHAYEANPHVAALLRENMAANAWTNVSVNEVALSDKEGELTFHISEDLGTLLGSVMPERGGGTAMRVKAARLSQQMAGMERINVVKMDVEGAEWPILADLLESGQFARPDQYLVEYHHQIGDERPRFTAFLKHFEDAGYRYHLSAKVRDVRGFQDILIHAQRG